MDPQEMRPPLGPDSWRLVGVDIDGTLMHWGGEISDPVAEAVERARMCRNHVILATGRNIMGMLPVAERLGLRRGWAVCSNGAVTVRLNPRATGGYDIVEKVTFNPRAALELIREEMPDAFFAVEDLGVGFLVNREFPHGELVGRQRVASFDELCHDEATRVVIRAPGVDVDHFDDLVHRIGLNDVTYAVGYSAWLDLTPPGVTKASALEALRRQLGVYPDHTVAVGDGNNDISMLEWAGQSAAMGTAPDHVKAVADEVLGSVEEDGVLTLLDRLIDPERLAVM
ncbi:HAD family hydrolase [Demequina mangrovi]|uniref:HAD-superfamily hydrolase, subfamily IIB n=1 Tax=Demequina mangrovi TaxID=1043493 RepID=A0A1H7B0M6_9MICO|nr:HAD family hydrolase [Demequina mangrovi]SEJ66895.1 HAD-superfamily hydrolase, subfamily IIB [Demequina mangrovi]